LRTTFRLCLVAAVVAAIGLVAVPAASATTGAQGHASITKFEKKQNKKIKKAKKKANKAHNRIENLKAWNFDLDAHNRRQDTSFNELLGTVNAIVAGVPDIVGGLTALQEGLVAIQGALEDPVTGLLGLNLARPQFGAFESDGTLIGATGASGGMGPDDDAVQGGPAAGPLPDLEGVYVVDFNNDVSLRMYTVNVFPLGPTSVGGGAAPTASAVNCSSSTAVADLCGLVQVAAGGTGASDPDPNKVAVQIGDGTDGAGEAPNGFSVTALSG
jgi:hypothetical protein